MTPLLIVLAILFMAGVFLFNRLVRLRNQVDAAWADIDVQLTRRHDLVPQLVTAVRAYAGHERATLEAVTELRARAVATDSPQALGQVESALEKALSRIFALKESYPDLKANENFAQLQRDLVEVEEHLQYARRFYNGAVRDLNTAVQRIPDVIIARAFGFKEAEFFQAGAEARGAASVEMGS
jgi:LemA protein